MPGYLAGEWSGRYRGSPRGCGLAADAVDDMIDVADQSCGVLADQLVAAGVPQNFRVS